MHRLLAMTAFVSAVALGQGRLTPAGMLASARTGHTATRLADGRVLVVGGRSLDGLTPLSSVEVFDPRKRTWRAGPPLLVARTNHTATLLPDGRVLVVGGTRLVQSGESTQYLALASAELFEPVNNRWLEVGPLAEARSGHSATLLPDGSVLVVGGTRQAHTFLASTERFDPRLRTFSPAPALKRARAQHAAVLLTDGSVVVVGGRDAHGSLDVTERFFDLGWTDGPAMSEPRQRMGAVAVESRGIVVIGGQTGTSSTNLAEAWRPAEARWQPLENHLSMALSGHTATLLPIGDLLVIGGEPPNEVDTSRVQRWVAASHTWCLAGELRTSRKGHTATLLADGRVLVVGGASSGVPERSVELWEDTKGPCEEPPGLSSPW